MLGVSSDYNQSSVLLGSERVQMLLKFDQSSSAVPVSPRKFRSQHIW